MAWSLLLEAKKLWLLQKIRKFRVLIVSVWKKLFKTRGLDKMLSTFGKNHDVIKALDQYISANKPGFAALINSPWGSGKTWFIRAYLENLRELDRKARQENENLEPAAFCYVSLFDVADTKDIDSAIITQIYPSIIQKGGRTVWRLSRYFLEKNKFLPLDPKINDDSVNLFKETMLSKPERFIAVMDDLERTSLSMQLVLGYVSTLLEEGGAKVILLCCEEKIPEDKKEVFLEFREKIVGMTLSVVPDVESVLDAAIDNVTDNDAKSVLTKNKKDIIHIFTESETNNLRHIRRIIYEFSQIFKNIGGSAKNDDNYISNLIKTLSIISIGVNSNSISTNDINCFRSKVFSPDIRKNMGLPNKDGGDNKVKLYFDKYSMSVWNMIPCEEFMAEFFKGGIVNSEKLKLSYTSSIYCKDKNKEIPIKLWYMREMNDRDICNLYASMKNDIDDYRYKTPGLILHAFGVILSLVEIGVEREKSKEDVVAAAKTYIDNVELDVSEAKKFTRIDSWEQSYYGLQFHKHDSDEFKKIHEAMKGACERCVRADYAEYVQEIFDLIPDDVDGFVERFRYAEDAIVWGQLSFERVNADEIAEKISKLQNTDVRKVMMQIFVVIEESQRGSYDKADVNAWCEELCSVLETYLNNMPPMAQNSARACIDGLRKAIGV